MLGESAIFLDWKMALVAKIALDRFDGVTLLPDPYHHFDWVRFLVAGVCWGHPEDAWDILNRCAYHGRPSLETQLAKHLLGRPLIGESIDFAFQFGRFYWKNGVFYQVERVAFNGPPVYYAKDLTSGLEEPITQFNKFDYHLIG